MKFKPLLISLHLLCVGMFVSCKDLIEPSIAKRTVVLTAPGDKNKTKEFNVNFWWEDVEDALTYRLQVVTPGFSEIGDMLADTIIREKKFTLSLRPGKYEWRVQALNGSSSTVFSAPRSFEIISSSLSEQVVLLQQPQDHLITAENKITLAWNSVFSAAAYQLQLDTNSFADTLHLVFNAAVTSNNYHFSPTREGSYKWRVRAQNETEFSRWSAIRSFQIDRTPPAAPLALSPVKGQTVDNPVLLKWKTVSGAAHYKLYLYKDPGDTPFDETFPVTVNNNSYNFTSGSPGDHLYWQVTATDAAGNESPTGLLSDFLLR